MAGRMQQDVQRRARSTKRAPGRRKDDEDGDWSMEEWEWDAKALSASRKPALGASGAPKLAQDEDAGKSRSRAATVCQVEGCEADLSNLKEYHQRYKICELHLKLHSLVREGRRQRFCQQCGRFHDLDAFDGEKRSCRARLQKHNARRRKKSAPASYRAAAAKPRADTAGIKRRKQTPTKQVKSESEPEAEDSPARKEHISASVLPSHAEMVDASINLDVMLNVYGRSDSRDSDATIFDGDQHAALQDLLDKMPQHSDQVGSPLPTSGNKPFDFLSDSDSLLMGVPISTPAHSPMQVYDGIPTLRETNPFACELQEEAALARLSKKDNQPSAMVEELSLARGGSCVFYNTADPARMPEAEPLTPLSALGLPDIFATQSLPSPLQGQTSPFKHARAEGGSLAQLDEPRFSLRAANPAPSTALDETRRVFAPHSEALQYQSDEYVYRMSMKLFKCSPAELWPGLKESLLSILSRGNGGVEGYMRSGCVLLTVDAHVGFDDLARLRALDPVQLTSLVLGSGNWASQPGSRAIAQWGNQVVDFKSGKCKPSSPIMAVRAMPEITSISPLAVLSTQPDLVQLQGTNLGKRGDQILVRSQGKYLEASQEGPSSSDSVSMQLPRQVRNAVVQVEVLHEGTLSTAKPLVILRSAAAVSEIRQLESGDVDNKDGLLMDLSRVLNYQNDPTASDAIKQKVASIARRLVVFALRRGWSAVTHMLLPSTQLDCADVAEAVRRMEQALDPAVTLLHLAVASGSLHLVCTLLEWATAGSCELFASAAGPGGLAPAHLASLHQDGGAMADLLTDLCADVVLMWHFPRFRGFTPAQFAAASGNSKFLEQSNARSALAPEQADPFSWILDSRNSDEDSDGEDSAFNYSDDDSEDDGATLTCASLNIKEQETAGENLLPTQPHAHARALLDTPMSFYAPHQMAASACDRPHGNAKTLAIKALPAPDAPQQVTTEAI